MTNFKLLSTAAILTVAIAAPAFAQQAVDEPGEQAFYQSLGVGAHSYSPRTAMAQAPRLHHHVHVKHVTPKTDTK
jgi:hypothetical protein